MPTAPMARRPEAGNLPLDYPATKVTGGATQRSYPRRSSPYLLNSLSEKLRFRLLAELEPGMRIVSYAFPMADWEPEGTRQVGNSVIYRWTIPPRK